MSTTQLFAELLITGIGVMIWLVFILAAVFKYSFQNIVSNTSIFAIAPILGVAYVLGIVIDRIGYSLFYGLKSRIREKEVKDETMSASMKERYILTNSEELSAQITYNRSRLRVCRSWIINFLLIAISSGIWGFSISLSQYILFPLTCIILAIVTFSVWIKLAEDYYENIEQTFAFLAKQGDSNMDE